MLKPIDNSATCSVVWPRDPAVDQEASDLVGYIGSDGDDGKPKVIGAALTDPGSWSKFLVMKDGQQPTEFILGAIPLGRMAYVARHTEGSPSLRIEALYASLRDIKNGWTMQTTDAKGRVVHKVPGEERDGTFYVDTTWLGATLPYQIAVFVGACAWAFNYLGAPDAKNS